MRTSSRRVLFVGQAYYNAWYLSRALRKLGWKADVLNWDDDPNSQKFYHGEDFNFSYNSRLERLKQVWFYVKALVNYDVFHFSNAHLMTFGRYLHGLFKKLSAPYFEVRLLKALGKKIVYSHNGCLDGVAQSSFRTWGPEPVCDICKWRNKPEVCSDARNLSWGRIRNELADYQCTLGGNRLDYNRDLRVHEVPEFYCLDTNFWRPDLQIPDKFRLPYASNTFFAYHGVGNFAQRTDAGNVNIKTTHIWLDVIERIRSEGHAIELIMCTDIPNQDVRYYQAQADVIVDMLTYGFFGANVREAMMLGKPAICFLRQEWLESMKQEIPDYVRELPVISATPQTAYEALKGLLTNRDKRLEVGRRSREFAMKWHSAEAGARRLDNVYSSLLRDKTR